MKKSIISVLFVSILLLAACSNNVNGTSSGEPDSSAFLSESSEPVSNAVSEESVETRIPTSFLLAEIVSGKTKTVFTYDDGGRIVLTVVYNNNVEYNRVKNVYDENGFLIEKEQVTSGNGRDVRTETFVNSSSGKPLEGTIKIKNGSSEFLSMFSYTYDENGNVIRYEQKSGNGQTEMICEYEYLDENGSYRMTTDNRTVNERYYDAAGNTIRNLSGSVSGNVYNDTSYTYDENNVLIKETYVDGTVIEYKNVFVDGKLVSKELSSDGEIMSSINYSYDEYGNQITIVEKNAAGTVVSDVTNVWTPVYE